MDPFTTLLDVEDLRVGDVIRPVASPDVRILTRTNLAEYVEVETESTVSGLRSKRFIRHGAQVVLVATVHLPTSWGPAGASACGHEAPAMATSGNPDEVTCAECRGTDGGTVAWCPHTGWARP
jgi:hypothetical protein